jgi:hypothetical protein
MFLNQSNTFLFIWLVFHYEKNMDIFEQFLRFLDLWLNFFPYVLETIFFFILNVEKFLNISYLILCSYTNFRTSQNWWFFWFFDQKSFFREERLLNTVSSTYPYHCCKKKISSQVVRNTLLILIYRLKRESTYILQGLSFLMFKMKWSEECVYVCRKRGSKIHRLPRATDLSVL